MPLWDLLVFTSFKCVASNRNELELVFSKRKGRKKGICWKTFESQAQTDLIRAWDQGLENLEHSLSVVFAFLYFIVLSLLTICSLSFLSVIFLD